MIKKIRLNNWRLWLGCSNIYLVRTANRIRQFNNFSDDLTNTFLELFKYVSLDRRNIFSNVAAPNISWLDRIFIGLRIFVESILYKNIIIIPTIILIRIILSDSCREFRQSQLYRSVWSGFCDKIPRISAITERATVIGHSPRTQTFPIEFRTRDSRYREPASITREPRAQSSLSQGPISSPPVPIGLGKCMRNFLRSRLRRAAISSNLPGESINTPRKLP